MSARTEPNYARSLLVDCMTVSLAALVLACEPADTAGDPGALIDVVMTSRVGVVLDEFPAATRDRAAELFLAKPLAFWEARARRQTRMTNYRLAFRQFFHDDKLQLPLPPDAGLHYEFAGDGPRRDSVDGHDVVVIDYTLTGTLLADVASIPASEPALVAVGGTWEEPFVLPLDPEYLRQRTGYACVDEEDFPPDSSDEENIADFFDHECDVEVAPDYACHLSEPRPTESCVDALHDHVGAVDTVVRFERRAWDPQRADEVRLGEVTTPDAPDLAVVGDVIGSSARLVYRYIAPDSCTMREGCVGGPGWRRLLQFDASVQNVGGADLHLGEVDYYGEGLDSELAGRNIYEYSDCHQHYHFRFYGDFAYATDEHAEGFKQSFCLQTTSRAGNHEKSPLNTPYGSCDYQGIAAGWGDDYIAGLDCQWVDVTDVAVPGASVTAPLVFTSNPDRFLCEGAPVRDDAGDLRYEPTDLRTETGAAIERPMCEFSSGWDANNIGERPVEIPAVGSYVTAACDREQEGPLRNCGFAEQTAAITCNAGETVELGCTIPAGAAPMAVRVCPVSAVLGVPLACTYVHALGNGVVDDGAMTTIRFTCPAPLAADEPGGEVSLFTAPLLRSDPGVEVACMPL